MNRIVTWILLLLGFGAFGTAAIYALRERARAGREMPAYSVYSEDDDGLAETARFLRKLNWEPVAMTWPIQQLQPGKAPRLLVMVEPKPTMSASEGGFSESEVAALMKWVEAGNTLLLCGRFPNAFHQALGVTVSTDLKAVDEDATRDVNIAAAGAYTDDLERVLVEGRDSLKSARGLPLWSLDGRVGAYVIKRGDGRVVVVADPSILTGRGLVRQDNALFLYNVALLHARDGRIYFDEYHHGLHSGGGFWGYISYHEQNWLFVPLLAALAIAVWSLGVRLGPAVAAPTSRQADAVDYASALARIYQGAGVRHLVAKVLARDFFGRLTGSLRLRRNALPAEVLAEWRARHAEAGAQDKRLEVLLRGVTELRKGDVAERPMMNWAREFDKFLKEM